ncbi:hypothetical protein VB636_02145 [Paracoccus sp. APAP_BH8]|uniref:Uncharacterized protein n=1 Tax=Paracoccus pantotrophus TaxID=82367 RepID=A0AAE6NU77_PARPN|nr:hypothetical protein [Paracoccus pantotrophus]QFG34953.1 hypothetical protein ESD82_01755 [Paracoccus pantotrophus]RNI16544.1 hypothetical protein EB844_13710 [Paracoccus pantotrophus]
MTKSLYLLEQAREDLLAFKAESALERITDFQELVRSGSISKDCVGKGAEMLRDILSLAGAARDGVAAAQRQLAEIAALSRHLNTYDRQGRKIGNPIAPPRERRF